MHKLVHMELMALFEEQPEQFEMSKFTTSSLDLIASIKTQIKQLAGEATLLNLDKQFKHSFIDRFPTDIPHIRDLPQDVYHNIELLPGAPISVNCMYVCPQKYCAGWKTLIDQHLAMG